MQSCGLRLSSNKARRLGYVTRLRGRTNHAVKHHLSSLNRVTLDVSEKALILEIGPLLDIEMEPHVPCLSACISHFDNRINCRVKRRHSPLALWPNWTPSLRNARPSFWRQLASWHSRSKRLSSPSVTTWTLRSTPVLVEPPSAMIFAPSREGSTLWWELRVVFTT